MSAAIGDFLVVGIGGAATGFVARAAMAFPGARALAFDCDSASAGTAVAAPDLRFVLLGEARFDGRGAGGDAVKSRAAVQDDAAAVREAIAGARLAVVAVSLGGGFGSGATPEILKIMRDSGVVTLCVAAKPFAFEGGDRDATARRAIPLIESSAAAIAPVALDDLFADAAQMPVSEAYAKATETMSEVLTLFWRMAAKPGFVSLGVERIAQIVAASSGHARIAVASGAGDSRASDAASALLASRLPGPDAKSASYESVIVGVVAGEDLRLAELSAISEKLRDRVPPTCRFDFGVIVDETVSGRLSIASILFERGLPADAVPVADTASASRPHAGKKTSKRDPLSAGPSGSRFKGTDGTIYNGQDLDIPTYLRRDIPLEK